MQLMLHATLFMLLRIMRWSVKLYTIAIFYIGRKKDRGERVGHGLCRIDIVWCHVEHEMENIWEKTMITCVAFTW